MKNKKVKSKPKRTTEIIKRKQILVRLKPKDNIMLDNLRVITKYKSNARNVMLASYGYLKQVNQIFH